MKTSLIIFFALLSTVSPLRGEESFSFHWPLSTTSSLGLVSTTSYIIWESSVRLFIDGGCTNHPTCKPTLMSSSSISKVSRAIVQSEIINTAQWQLAKNERAEIPEEILFGGPGVDLLTQMVAPERALALRNKLKASEFYRPLSSALLSSEKGSFIEAVAIVLIASTHLGEKKMSQPN